jgi:hypothetical protein
MRTVNTLLVCLAATTAQAQAQKLQARSLKEDLATLLEVAV